MGNKKAQDNILRPGKSHIAVNQAALTPKSSVPKPTPAMSSKELLM